jgi:ribosomal protein S18 acetylase RimI-like enzyme
MLIRKAHAADAAAILDIILPTIREGGTYALDNAMADSDALAYWTSAEKETFVAEDGGLVVGTYYLKANQAGGGQHVCNCGFMTKASATGRGVAKNMCQHALAHAKAQGYKAMQFNFVVSTNDRAIQLWQSMGFEIVGRLPLAFLHPHKGYVDALVMYQQL